MGLSSHQSCAHLSISCFVFKFPMYVFENRDLKKNEKLCFIKFIILVQIYFKGYLGTYKYYLDGQIIFASGDNLSTNLWNYPFLIWILLLIISETVIFPSTSQMFSVSKNLWEFSRPCLLRKRSYWGHHWADPLLEGWALAWVSPRTGRWDSCPLCPSLLPYRSRSPLVELPL